MKNRSVNINPLRLPGFFGLQHGLGQFAAGMNAAVQAGLFCHQDIVQKQMRSAAYPRRVFGHSRSAMEGMHDTAMATAKAMRLMFRIRLISAESLFFGIYMGFSDTFIALRWGPFQSRGFGRGVPSGMSRWGFGRRRLQCGCDRMPQARSGSRDEYARP